MVNDEISQSYIDAGKYYRAPSSSPNYYKGSNYWINNSVEPSKRSALDRLFDMLQVGQYTVQGGIHGALDPNQSVGQGMWEGLKASNPFGAGNVKGEYTFSDNLGKMGWNPTSLGGKIAKGTLGFIGDVALDPSTYINPLSIGGDAILKGTGTKVGKEIVEKFTPEMAEKALKATGKAVPTIDEISDTVRRVNKARGIIEEGTGKGFGIYGSNIPFANKLGIADKKIEFVGEAKLRAFGDSTFAKFTNKIGDDILHSKVGKLFTTKADMLDLARRDPDALVKGFEFARLASLEKINFKEAMVKLKPEFDELKELDPASQKQIIAILEDKNLWKDVTSYKPLMDIKEGQDLHEEVLKSVDKFGRGNKEMDKILNDILPKHQPGDKVIARFPGVEDANVEIEHVATTALGQRYYKLKGFDKLAPESALLSKSEITKEAKEIATKRKIQMLKQSIEKGERGNINMSDEATNSLDELIANGRIKRTLRQPLEPIKDFDLKDFNPSIRDSSDVVKSSMYRDKISTEATNKFNKAKEGIANAQNNIKAYEKRIETLTNNLNPKQAKSRIDDLNLKIKDERSKLEKFNKDMDYYSGKARDYTPANNQPLQEVAVDKVTVDGKKYDLNNIDAKELKPFNVDETGRKYRIRNQWASVPEWTTSQGKKIKGGRRLSAHLSLDKEGNLINSYTKENLGNFKINGKVPQSSKPLANITKVDGLDVRRWNKIKTEGDAEIRAFFNNIIEKDPVVNDMFIDLKKTGKFNDKVSIKKVTSFIDSYYKTSTHDLWGGVHRFNVDYSKVQEILESEFGKWENLSKGEKATRNERMFELFNNPQELQKKSELSNIKKYDIDGSSKDIVTLMEQSIKSAEQRADEYSTKLFKQQDNRHGYALQLDNVSNKQVEAMDFNVIFEDGTFMGKAKATEWNHDEITHIEYKGQEILVSDLEKRGYGIVEAKPTNVTGEVVGKKVFPKSALKSAKDTAREVDKLYVKQDLDEQIEKGLAYIFEDSEVAIDKIESEIHYDMPADKKVRSKSKAELEKEITGGVDVDTLKQQAKINEIKIKENEIAEKVMKESVQSLEETTKKGMKAKYTKDNHATFLANEGRATEQMLSKSANKKTIEDALNEIPEEVNRILSENQQKISDYEKLQYKIQMQREALSNQTQFESYAKTIWGDEKYNEIMEKHKSTVKAIDKTDWENQDIIDVAKDIHETFGKIAVEEFEAGKLEKIIEGYCTHMFNPEFISPLEKFNPEELSNMGIKIPKNSFDITREYKVGTQMPNGYVLKEGTEAEINKAFTDMAKSINKSLIKAGKSPIEVQNLFIDQISDVYLNRMQKHYQLMYDHNVFGDLANKFGTVYGERAGDIRKVKTMKDGAEVWSKMRINPKTGEATVVKNGDTVIKEGHTLVVSTEQIKKELKNVEPENIGKTMEMLGIDKNALDKLGNSFMRIDEATAKQYNKLGIADVHQIPDNVLDKAENLGKTQFASDTHGLLKAYDKFLLMYKKMVTAYTPSFHINNIKGNTFNNYLDVGVLAMSPKMQSSAVQIMKGTEGSLITKSGKEISYSQIRKELKVLGIDDTGFFGTIKKDIFNPEVKPKATGLKRIDEGIMNASSNVEYHAKIVNFISNLHLDKSFTEAGEHVDKFLFDYSNITKFEHDVMQRIIPFYTWISKNAPLQLEQMLTNPKRYMPVIKAIDEIEHMTNENNRIDKNKVPAFARDWVQLPFNIMNEKGNEETLMWSNNLPYMDVNKIPNIFELKDSLTNIFESSTPALKVPVELGTNYNYFFDKPIDKGKKVLDPSGQFEVSPQLAYILGQVPQYAIPGGAVRKQGIDRLIHIFDKGLSSGVKSYDNKGYGGGVMLK